MRSRTVVRLIIASTLLCLPVLAHAQDISVSALISGTVTDVSGAVLPGATVRAVHEATGNSFETVTDERGAFRLSVRVGRSQVAVMLPGFTTQTRTVELLLGQTGVVNVQLPLSTITETVTVSGAAPLIEVTTSTVGGNVDPRQVQELPVNGRNYIALAMLAPGSRTVPVTSGTAREKIPRSR